jgi:hypothetical protein
MDTRDEILIAIGRIEGKLEAFANPVATGFDSGAMAVVCERQVVRYGHNGCVAVSRLPVEVIHDYLHCATSILDGRGRLLDFAGRVFVRCPIRLQTAVRLS